MILCSRSLEILTHTGWFKKSLLFSLGKKKKKKIRPTSNRICLRTHSYKTSPFLHLIKLISSWFSTTKAGGEIILRGSVRTIEFTESRKLWKGLWSSAHGESHWNLCRLQGEAQWRWLCYPYDYFSFTCHTWPLGPLPWLSGLCKSWDLQEFAIPQYSQAKKKN